MLNLTKTKLIWIFLSILGAVAFSTIALSRDESINALWFITAAVCIYLVAYRFYGAWIAAKVLVLDEFKETPAVRNNNGRMRLFESGTGWTLDPSGRLRGTNDLSCAFISYYELIGTCNNGINYGLCSLNVNADICGTDGTNYSFSNDGSSVRSSFGSRCNISSMSTEIFFNC